MPFKRKGRPNLYFQARTRTGWKQLCTGTPNRTLAPKIEGMWEHLATYERAWTVLDRVWMGTVPVARLYDAWIASNRNAGELQRRLDDVDIEPMVAEWHKVKDSQAGADWAAHALAHVRTLIPEGVALPASSVTTDCLTTKLAALDCARNTRRKYTARGPCSSRTVPT